MDIAKRIAQFENMAQADPSNEMAHFSLAKAYADDSRFADAARSYLRCTQLVPDMSKAYQMAGEAFIKAGQPDDAAQVLMQGFVVAAQKGDLMPKNAMAAMLKDLGRTPPEVASAPKLATAATPNYDPSSPLPAGMIVCTKSGRPGTRMSKPPFKGVVGEWIAANISRETFFQAWLPQGTKVINELRLDLSREKDQELYDQHMREYLGLDEATLASLNSTTTSA